MLKSIFSLLDTDGSIQMTANKKGEIYTLSIVPFDKPELSISLTGSIEEIEKDMINITPKYKVVIKTAAEQVVALETKVKEAAKKKVKKTELKAEIKKPGEGNQNPVPLNENKKNQALEDDAQDINETAQLEALEDKVKENNKVLDATVTPINKDFEKEITRTEQSLF